MSFFLMGLGFSIFLALLFINPFLGTLALGLSLAIVFGWLES